MRPEALVRMVSAASPRASRRSRSFSVTGCFSPKVAASAGACAGDRCLFLPFFARLPWPDAVVLMAVSVLLYRAHETTKPLRSLKNRAIFVALWGFRGFVGAMKAEA